MAKSALVTDVQHFVGLAAAEALSADGFRVYAADDAFAHAEARDAFAAAHPEIVPLAAESSDDLAAAMEAAPEDFTVFVSNDAHPAQRIPVAEGDADRLRSALEALTVRPYERIARLVPLLRRVENGRIVCITSAAPLEGLANYGPYCTARGATNALVRSLALELARDGITVNALAPNFVKSATYFPDDLMADEEKARKVLKNVPLGRLGTQTEAGAAVRYLASPEAGFVTGHVLPFAGGWA